MNVAWRCDQLMYTLDEGEQLTFQQPRMMRSSQGVADETSVRAQAIACRRCSGLSSI